MSCRPPWNAGAVADASGVAVQARTDASRPRLLQFPRAIVRPVRREKQIRVLSVLPFTTVRAAPQMDPDSSADLLARVRAGDQDGLDVLLRRYVPALRRWARGRLPRWARDLSETEDLVQDTVLKTFRGLNTFEFRHDGALRAYLREAVMNRIRDECRRVTRKPAASGLDERTPSDAESPLEAAIGRQAVERYESALQLLQEEERQAVVARIEMGFSFQEIAVMLGKPSADAARMTVSRSLVRLAQQLNNGR